MINDHKKKNPKCKYVLELTRDKYLLTSATSDKSDRHLVLLNLGDKKVPAYIAKKRFFKIEKDKIEKDKIAVLIFGLGEESESALSNLTDVRFSLIGFFGSTVHEYDAASYGKLTRKKLYRALLDPGYRFVPPGAQDILNRDAEGIFQVNATALKPNEKQEEALEKLLDPGGPPVHVVQGPPGTGKSSIIPNFCRMVSHGGKIVIVCQTNKAVGVCVDKVKVLESASPRFTLPWPRPLREEVSTKKVVVTLIGNLDAIAEEAKPYHIKRRARGMLELDPYYKQLVTYKEDLVDFIMGRKDDVRKPEAVKERLFHSDLKPALKPALKDFKKLMECIEEADSDVKEIEEVERLKEVKQRLRGELDRSGLEKMVITCINDVFGPYMSGEKGYMIGVKTKLLSYIKEETTIFVSTVATLAISEFKDLTADLMIVDEAGTVSEESMPLVLRVDPSYLVLIGDHKQLPPFSNIRQKDEPVSFMERCVDAFEEHGENAACEFTMLDEQRRMTPRLCDIVSTLTYDSKLITASSVSERENDVIWLESSQAEEKIGTSFRNCGEANLVVKAVERVKDPKKTIKVITFYKPQLEVLKSRLKDLKGLNGKVDVKVDVCTVDSAQGSEADIVIVSCVRCNERRDIGFLGRENRVNVAISRAKEQLVIIGNLDTCKGWKKEEEKGKKKKKKNRKGSNIWFHLIEMIKSSCKIIAEVDVKSLPRSDFEGSPRDDATSPSRRPPAAHKLSDYPIGKGKKKKKKN
jgi:hypothetical protein